MDVREFLFRKNMSKRQLSEILGCNYQSVCHWVRGTHLPNIATAKKLIEFSKGEITIEDLYGKSVGIKKEA